MQSKAIYVTILLHWLYVIIKKVLQKDFRDIFSP